MLSAYQKSTLHYSTSGSGPKALLLFHGFGQDHTIFQTFAKELEKHFTLYSIDLYFHGNSTWGYNESPLSKEFWKEVLQQFLKENNIDRFSVVGFSLGGKFALATAEALPEKTESIFLIAPDGIKTSIWYSLATYPLLLRGLFKSMIANPGLFFSLGQWLQKLNLIHKGLLRFAEHQMDTAEKRKRVYYSWVVFRRLAFRMKPLGEVINHHDIKLTIVVGKHDKVIQPQNMQRLLQHVHHPVLVIEDAGHNHLLNSHVARMLLPSTIDGKRPGQ